LSGCERCNGTGFERVDRDGREIVRPCACRRPAPGPQGDDAFLSACRIPPRYEDCRLSTFDPISPSHASALEKALKFCRGYPFLGHDEGLGLLLTGNTGVGKTHLAVAVLRELVTQKGARGQFWDFHQLMREIKNSYDAETKTTEIQVLAPVMETDILLLDDLGAWRITDWMNDTLFQILNSRYLAKRPTLITTNFQDRSVDEVKRADALERREFFVDRIGQRLRSRIVEMCLIVQIDGKDFREMRQESNRTAVLGTSERSAGERAPEAPRKPPTPRFGG
jgi:DNA replication protein DnaC